jgi:hypothetical protein
VGSSALAPVDGSSLLVGIVRVSVAQAQQYTVGKPIAAVTPLIYSQARARSIDPAFALAESILETGWGRSTFARQRHNWYAYEAYYQDPDHARRFSSDEEGVAVALDAMLHQYFTPGGAHYGNGEGRTLSAWARSWVDGPPQHWRAAVHELCLLMTAMMAVPDTNAPPGASPTPS